MSVKNQFKHLQDRIEHVLAIHCSTEGFFDAETGMSPRVTGIAIHSIEHDITHNFAYYLTAEKLGIPAAQFEQNLDRIEAEMLSEFFSFCKENEEKLYVHWNMSSVFFGFQLLEHRYEVLTKKKPFLIPDHNKFNLSLMIRKRFGRSGEDGPKMRFLMELNNGMHPTFVDGVDEVSLFQNGAYVKLQQSTTRKALWFATTLKNIHDGTFKARAFSLKELISHFFETIYVKSLGFIAILFSLYRITMLLIHGND